MQLKDFVSKKGLILGVAVVGLLAGIGAGLAYQSAHGQQANAGNSTQNNTGIMPQKSYSSNGAANKTDASATGTAIKKAKPSTAKKNSTSIADAACMVKAETNSKGLKVFYLPNMRGYAKVPSTTCFKTAELAAAAGYKSATAK